MDLVIDIGNTFAKVALFSEGRLHTLSRFSSLSLDDILDFTKAFSSQISAAIVSSVRDYPSGIDAYLEQNYFFIHLEPATAVPIKSNYETPETLGKDRLAVAVAAASLFPGTNALVIDAGTALTYDLVTASATYFGGAISPGIQMRFDALHHFTGKLPLLSGREKVCLVGKNTRNSILSGVLNGILAEVKAIVEDYQKMFPELQIIFTGGDYKYFVDKLNFPTFAEPNLVLMGLQKILEFNRV